MLTGHVERVSHNEIEGWAADDERPYETVEVSIFVNEHKRAQLACDLGAPELRQIGIWGDGKRGFCLSFPAALGRDATHRVSVRFTATGHSLKGGEVRLSPDGAITEFPMRDDTEAAEMLRLPSPTTPRETFALFPFYQQSLGLGDLLARADFAVRHPRDIQYAVFGALHTTASQEYEFAGTYSPRDHLHELLMSPAFQHELATLVLNAFPEKRRLLFVHTPKCAGSDLSRLLMTRYPSIDRRLMEQRCTSKDALFAALHDLMRALPSFNNIFVRGHIRLDWYLDHGLARPIDRLFTIIRHPVEIALSQTNHVIKRIAADMESGKVCPDTRHWLDLLRLREIPPWPLADLAVHVRRRALRTHEIVTPNPLCYWLGGGDAVTVLTRLAQSGAEVTETSRYNQWLRETWGIESVARLNEGRKFIS